MQFSNIISFKTVCSNYATFFRIKSILVMSATKAFICHFIHTPNPKFQNVPVVSEVAIQECLVTVDRKKCIFFSQLAAPVKETEVHQFCVASGIGRIICMSSHATICYEQKQTLNLLKHNQNKQTVYNKDLILSLEKI